MKTHKYTQIHKYHKERRKAKNLKEVEKKLYMHEYILVYVCIALVKRGSLIAQSNMQYV